MPLEGKKLSSEKTATSTPTVNIHCASNLLPGGVGRTIRQTSMVAHR